MATLILTAVGTAVAGPIGGALGALAGQAVDRMALGGSGSHREGPRLSELKVQTSSYGTQIPRVLGRMRVAGTVIWASDLIETSQRSGGGKGRPSSTSYSYAVSLAVALSSGPVQAVGRIWADGNLLRGGDGGWITAPAAFRLHCGQGDERPDPLIEGAVGLGAAPAHRGLAYALFEGLPLASFGNRIPSLSFELIEREGAVSAAELAGIAGAQVAPEAEPGVMLGGFALAGADRRAALAELVAPLPQPLAPAGAALAWAQPQRGPVSLAPLASADARPLPRPAAERASIASVPRRLSLRHHNPDQAYQAGLQLAERAGAGRSELVIDWPASLSPAAAAAVVRTALADRSRARMRVSLGVAQQPSIAPGGLIELPGFAGPWRIDSVEHRRASLWLDCSRAAAPLLPERAAAPALDAGEPDLPAGPLRLLALELPPLDPLGLGGKAVAIAAAGEGWRGALVSRSLAGAPVELGPLPRAAIFGSADSALAPAPPTLEDDAHALLVTLGAGDQLQDAGPELLDRGANLALLGAELIAFGTAAPLGGGRWRLARLRRGLAGSDDAADHLAGEPFLLLERERLLLLDAAALRPGETLELTVEGPGSAGGATASLIYQGRMQRPIAPVHGRAEPDGAGGLLLSWIRRTRADHGWLDGVDEPLGEDQERYRIALLAGAELRWTGETAEPRLALTAAERATIGLVTVASIVQIGRDALSPPLLLPLP